jgi:hypothetical protein
MNILELDGKRYELVEIPAEPKRKTGYERDIGGMYYTAYPAAIMSFTDCTNHDADVFNKANYYTDKQLALDNARADALMRNLRRFSAEGRSQRISWTDFDSTKFILYFDYVIKKIKTTFYTSCREFGGVSFDTRELAEAAIEKYRDELMWYFTEYQDTAEFREDVQQ